MMNRCLACSITILVLWPVYCAAQPPKSGGQAESFEPAQAPAASAETLESVPPVAVAQVVDAARLAAIELRSDVCFHEVDGVRLLADFFRPPISGDVPVLLVIHGGGWVAGDKSHITSHAYRIAAEGFAVLSINYRLAPRYPFPAQLEDVYAALRYIDQNADSLRIDRSRIGVWGYSAGGHLAALASVYPQPGTPRPVVCVAGGAPCDFTRIPARSTALAAFLGGPRAEREETYTIASPATHASADDPPMFFINGDSDLLVPQANSMKLRKRLDEAGVTTAVYTAKFQGHMATFLNLNAVDAGIDFVSLYLKATD